METNEPEKEMNISTSTITSKEPEIEYNSSLGHQLTAVMIVAFSLLLHVVGHYLFSFHISKMTLKAKDVTLFITKHWVQITTVGQLRMALLITLEIFGATLNTPVLHLFAATDGSYNSTLMMLLISMAVIRAMLVTRSGFEMLLLIDPEELAFRIALVSIGIGILSAAAQFTDSMVQEKPVFFAFGQMAEAGVKLDKTLKPLGIFTTVVFSILVVVSLCSFIFEKWQLNQQKKMIVAIRVGETRYTGEVPTGCQNGFMDALSWKKIAIVISTIVIIHYIRFYTDLYEHLAMMILGVSFQWLITHKGIKLGFLDWIRSKRKGKMLSSSKVQPK